LTVRWCDSYPKPRDVQATMSTGRFHARLHQPQDSAAICAGDLEKRHLVGVYPNQTDGTPIHCSNDPECLTGGQVEPNGCL